MFLPLTILIAQQNPMTFEQGPLWMVLVAVFAIGGYLLFSLLTRTEAEPSPIAEDPEPEPEPEPEQEVPAPSSSTALAEVATAAVVATKSAPKKPKPVKKAPAPAPVVLVTPTDDFTRVEGVGPKIASILAEAGIMTYAQLAETSVERLYKIVRDDAKIRVAVPDTWPEQAALAAADRWEELKTLQDSLKGGRRVA